MIYDRSVIVREHVLGITRKASPLAFAHCKGAIPSEKVEEYGVVSRRHITKGNILMRRVAQGA
jgi:hypothetical protein